MRPSRFQPDFSALTLALASALAIPSLAHAQSVAGDTRIAFSLEAQPLGAALNDLAGQAGLQLLVRPELVAGRSAPALVGSMTARQALVRLLERTGLIAVVDGAAVTVRPAPPEATSETTLTPVVVTGRVERNPSTEGSGAYVAQTTTIGLGEHSVRETPNSVSVVTRQRLDDQTC